MYHVYNVNNRYSSLKSYKRCKIRDKLRAECHQLSLFPSLPIVFVRKMSQNYRILTFHFVYKTHFIRKSQYYDH